MQVLAFHDEEDSQNHKPLAQMISTDGITSEFPEAPVETVVIDDSAPEATFTLYQKETGVYVVLTEADLETISSAYNDYLINQ